MTNNVKEKEKKKKRSSIHLNSKGRPEAGDAEFLIVQSIKEPLGVGSATPPQVVLSISHEAWDKHELWRIHQNLWVISTHQLTPHPLHQVDYPQAHSFEGLGNIQSNDGSSFQIQGSRKELADPWSLVDL